MALFDDIIFSLKARCPVCKEGKLFKPWSLTTADECSVCHAKLGENDVGDGASVFLIFILGFTIVPMALIFEHYVHPPLWVHAVLWTFVALGGIAILAPTVKAYVILLEYRYRVDKK